MKENNLVSSLIMVIFNYRPNLSQVIRAVSNESIDYVEIVDNSTERINDISSMLDSFGTNRNKVNYIANSKNIGLSKALNLGIKKGIERGCNLFFILDQDAQPTEGYFDHMKSIFKSVLESDMSTGAIAPIVTNSRKLLGKNCGLRTPVSKVKMLINSGMVVPLTTYSKIGLYDENLFLDSVDTEFINRLISAGLNVYRYNKVMVYQNFGRTLLGNSIYIRFLTFIFKFLSFLLVALGKSNIIYSNIAYYPETRRLNIKKEGELIIARSFSQKIWGLLFITAVDILIDKLHIDISYE